MVKILVIGTGGFIGAVARYALSGLVHRLYAGTFPAGTLVVNAAGCLLIGALMSLVEDHQLFSPNARLFLAIGLLGSFTTFSTVGYETVEFLRAGAIRLALLNVVANAGIGILAVLLGRGAVKAIAT